MDVLAVSAPHDAPKEELGARALPAIHPRPADVLDGVLGARVGVAGDVEGADSCGVVLGGTEGHAAPPSSCPRI
jgi:hypothetical protein